MAQTIKNGSGANLTTAAHQTFVMTFEKGYDAVKGSAGGDTEGIYYASASNFFMINNDTCFDNSGVRTDGNYGAASGQMYQYAWSFSTDSCSKTYTGKTMTIRLGGGTTSGGGYNYFDNIHLYGQNNGALFAGTVPTPEPSTVTLLVTGGLGILAYTWRRRRTA
jgi:hypothetical protein